MRIRIQISNKLIVYIQFMFVLIEFQERTFGMGKKLDLDITLTQEHFLCVQRCVHFTVDTKYHIPKGRMKSLKGLCTLLIFFLVA